MPGRTESPSAQLGQLLLRGWTMLAEACEHCRVPLMRDPSTMLGHCVGCRKVYNAEGQVVQEGVVEPAAPTAAMNGPVSTAGNSNSSSSPPANQAPAAANATAAAAAPALQQQQRQQQQQQSEEPGLDEARQRYQQMRQQREAAAGAAAGGGSDSCQVLSDHLLQGWTMLGDHCPICSSPLMRSRAQQVRCVVCDLPVQMQGSTPPPAAAAAAATETPIANGPLAAQAAVPAAGEPSSAAQQQQQQQQPATAIDVPRPSANPSSGPSNEAPQQQQQQLQAGALAGPMASGSGGSLRLQQQQVLSGLQHVLLCKLEESRQLLMQTPAAQPDRLAQQLQLLQQLLQALAATQQGMTY